MPAEEYTALDYEERPPHFVSFVPRDGGRRACEGGWRDDPVQQLLVAARREIGRWSSPDSDLADALSAVWPQLEKGFAMIPSRPCDRLQRWRSNFLAIAASESESGGSRGGSRGGSGPDSPFFGVEDNVVGLI